eukprot:gene9252-10370_t
MLRGLYYPRRCKHSVIHIHPGPQHFCPTIFTTTYLLRHFPNVPRRPLQTPDPSIVVFRKAPAGAGYIILVRQQTGEVRVIFPSELALLEHLRIISNSSEGIMISSPFKEGLIAALQGTGKLREQCSEPKYSVTIEDLDQYADQKWEDVLKYMVGGDTLNQDAVKKALTISKLIAWRDDVKDFDISPLGFQFLLQDRQTQLWFYVIHFLKCCQAEGSPIADALGFVFRVAYSTLGNFYSTEALTLTEKFVLRHFAKIGLCYHRKKKSRHYYPTPLGIALRTTSLLGRKDANEGFLIIETNFRIYAYTKSELKISLLKLFAKPLYKLPTMLVASITRSSVRRAMQQGLTAQQILHFLKVEVHCSSRMQSFPSSPFSPIPPTVSDQILLWEQESNRLSTTNGVLFRHIPKPLLHPLLEFTKSQNMCIWYDLDRCLMIISHSSRKAVKDKLRELKTITT